MNHEPQTGTFNFKPETFTPPAPAPRCIWRWRTRRGVQRAGRAPAPPHTSWPTRSPWQRWTTLRLLSFARHSLRFSLYLLAFTL